MAKISEEYEKEILDTYNSIVNHKEKNPLLRLNQLIGKTRNPTAPALSICYALRSDILLEQGNFDEAFANAYIAYDIDPTRKQVLHSLVNLHVPRPESPIVNSYADEDKSITFLEQLVKVSQNDASMLHCCGVVYYQLRKYDEAIKTFESALLQCEEMGESNETKKTKEMLCQDLTSCYLERYKNCPDSMNFCIMKYLIELLSFKGNTLNQKQVSDATEEVKERCEYVMQEACEKHDWSQMKECMQLIKSVIPLTKTMCAAITECFQSTRETKEGIEFFNSLLSLDAKVEQKEIKCLLSNRAMMYDMIGDTHQARKDRTHFQALHCFTPGTPSLFEKENHYHHHHHHQHQQQHQHRPQWNIQSCFSEGKHKQDLFDMEHPIQNENQNQNHLNQSPIDSPIHVNGMLDILSPNMSENKYFVKKNETMNSNSNSNSNRESFSSPSPYASTLFAMSKRTPQNEEEKPLTLPVGEMSKDELFDELKSTREQLAKFALELSQIKTRYQKLERALQGRDEIIAEMKLEEQSKNEILAVLQCEIDAMKKKQTYDGAPVANKSRASVFKMKHGTDGCKTEMQNDSPITPLEKNKATLKNKTWASSTFKSLIQIGEWTLVLVVFIYLCVLLQQSRPIAQ